MAGRVLTDRQSRHVFILLWLGFSAPILRHLLIYSLGIATPGYSSRRDFLSELSALDAPYSVLMGVFGVGLVGLLMLAAAIGIYFAIRNQPLGRLTAGLVAISGLGFVLVALAPCDPGCVAVDSSVRMKIHLVGGLLGMGAEVAAALTFGIGGLIHRQRIALSRASVVLAVVGLLTLVVLYVQPASLIGSSGLVQRIVQGVGDFWLLIVCWYLAGERVPSAAS